MFDRWVCRYFVAEPGDGTVWQLALCAIVIVAGLMAHASMPMAEVIP